MKICHCRNIDEVDAARVIKNLKLDKAEDVHRNLCGKMPDCGACLVNIQSLIDTFHSAATIPPLSSITSQQRKAAAHKLGERFTQEERENPDPAPAYKERYTRLYKNVCKT